MGFYSANCHKCGHPALCSLRTTPINAWMEQVVVLTEDGKHIEGEYDGYGRVDTGDGDPVRVFASEPSYTPPCLWHRACFESYKKPPKFKGPSDNADDQGWFFNDGDHDMPDPSLPKQVRVAMRLASRFDRLRELPYPECHRARRCGELLWQLAEGDAEGAITELRAMGDAVAKAVKAHEEGDYTVLVSWGRRTHVRKLDKALQSALKQLSA